MQFELEKGQVFVAGLHWQVLASSAFNAKKEAYEIAEQLNFDLAVRRTSGVQQVGLAATINGYKTGQLSAAAVISKTLEMQGVRDFICATQIPDGRFLYVAQIDGAIRPDGDLIGDAETIAEQLRHDLSMDRSWGKVIAPADWGINLSSEERQFVDFVPRKGDRFLRHKWWVLQPVKQDVRKNGLLLFIICASIALGTLGYKEWQKREAAKQAALLAAQSATPQAPPPWTTQPRAPGAVSACVQAFDAIPTIWAGNWIPQNANCSGGSIVLTWQRNEYGWIEHLLEIEPRANILAEGNAANVVFPVGQVPIGNTNDVLPTSKARTLEMQITGQRYGLALSLTPIPVPVPTDPNQPPQQWQEIKWAVNNTFLSPVEVVSVLDAEGFRFNSMTVQFSNTGLLWSLEGSQYVLP